MKKKRNEKRARENVRERIKNVKRITTFILIQ